MLKLSRNFLFNTLTIVLLAGFSNNLYALQNVLNLRTCYQTNPLGLEERPDFSWQMKEDKPQYGKYGNKQTAYRIMVAENEENLKKGLYVYDSGKTSSGISVCIPYQGQNLKPSTRYFWQVYVWNQKGKLIKSQEPAWFETSLLNQDWGGARWIGSQQHVLSKNTGMAEINFDFQIAEGSSQACFVFGCRDSNNYVSAEINLKDKKAPLFILRKNANGTETTVCEQNISDILPTNTLHQPHHFFIKMISSDAYKAYNLDFALDGKNLKEAKYASKNNNCFVVALHPGDLSYIYCRLNAVGFLQPKGQHAIFKNLKIDEPFHKVTLYDDGKTYDVQGDGKLQTWIPGGENSAPMMRKTFTINKTIQTARLYATARGIYEMYINGKAVSQDFFNPGWTDYRYRQNYNTFDVTNLLKNGQNAVGAILGCGWFTGNVINTPFWSNQYGTDISLMSKLVITFTDGTTQTILSDSSWLCYDKGPVTSNGWLDGEDYDARKEVTNWTAPNFDDSSWKPVKIYSAPSEKVIMQAYIGQPVRVDEVRTALKMTEPLPNHYVYDMGQNMVGVPHITLKGKNGQQITLNYCEMLYPEIIPTEPVAPYTIDIYQQKHGQIYTDNYRSALSTDHYTCKGAPEGEVFEPHLTSHGFRYIQITGTDAPLPLEDVQVLVLNSLEKPQTSSYETSDSLINKLYSNIVWGQKGNFLSVPTDCPQRDERLGWSGDAQIFTRTATYNRNVSPFYTRWLYTVRDDQGDDGDFSNFNPSVGDITNGNNRGGGAFGWAEVGIITPWQVYQQYGNTSILEESYSSMKHYMDYIEKNAHNYIQPLGGYGDWVALRGTISDLTNTAFAAYDAQIMSQVAKVLHHEDDSQHYSELFEHIKQAFAQRYLRENGQLIKPAGSPAGTDSYSAAFGGGGTTDKDLPIDTQTGYVMPLYTNLFDGKIKEQAVARLVDLLKENNYCLNTGFIGTPYLNIVLSENGYDDVAYKMFQQTAYPSWIYPVLQGATTIWERWNSYTLKNGFGPVDMNSFNHYSYGSIQDWMMAYSAGIQRDENNPGYKHFMLQPRIGGNFSFIHASYSSVYGNIVSRWDSNNKTLAPQTDAAKYGYTYTAEVPPNTSATLTLPLHDQHTIDVKMGKKGILSKKIEKGKAIYELSAGLYTFCVK